MPRARDCGSGHPSPTARHRHTSQTPRHDLDEESDHMTTQLTTAAPPAPAAARPPRRTGGSTLVRRRQRWGWLFVVPFLVVFALFLIFPLCYAFGMSLFTSTLAT